jgi:hypothetical protein
MGMTGRKRAKTDARSKSATGQDLYGGNSAENPVKQDINQRFHGMS